MVEGARQFYEITFLVGLPDCELARVQTGCRQLLNSVGTALQSTAETWNQFGLQRLT